MIASDKRLVVFIDYVGNDSSRVPYLLPEFGMVRPSRSLCPRLVNFLHIAPGRDKIWETPYDATNATFPCSIDRIRGPLQPSDQMYLINHNLDLDEFGILLSDWFDAPTTNGVTSCVVSPSLHFMLGRVTQTFVTSRCGRIVANANECAPLASGRYPNFILLDYVNIGNALTAVNQLNGLR